MAFDASLSRLRRLIPVIATRALLVGVFVVVYLVAWRPVRSWVATDVMGPALSRIETPRSDQYSVRAGARVVVVQHIESSDRVGVMKTPTGNFFVLAGMFLIALYPRHPYWLYVAAYQLGLGALMLGMLAVGVGWADWGFAVFHFLEGEFYQGTSLAIPFLLLRADGRALFGAVASDAGRSETETSEE
ncbi:hypothetical protein [Salinibacter ruber]|uniref:hypothetical protein n=1 Tax=Salinibacter ruber TaxID=146919 RepID=UPI00216743F0|nr:hypothetical protein [Salinibacter ruber]MCS4039952.1 hypothetical protein [Salinibacter ruber]